MGNQREILKLLVKISLMEERSVLQGNDYYKAAEARIQEAHHLHAQGYYVLAMYASGLAVECLLRAFRLLDDSTFDERHDLLLMWKRTKLANVNDELYNDAMYTAMTQVAVLWRNDYRFSSPEVVRAHLKRIHQDRGIKGDFLKYNSRKLFEAAEEVFHLGTQRWKRLKKK